MKRILIAVFTMLLCFCLFYLLGAFVNRSLDLNKWSDPSLQIVGGMGGIVSIFAGVLAFFANELKC